MHNQDKNVRCVGLLEIGEGTIWIVLRKTICLDTTYFVHDYNPTFISFDRFIDNTSYMKLHVTPR